MTKNRITNKKALLLIFVVIMGFGLLTNVSNLSSSVKNSNEKTPDNIETIYNEQLFMRKELININGLVRRTLNQKLVNGTIKAKDGQLFLVEDTEYVFIKSQESTYAQKALNILEAAKDNGAAVLYVQHPNKYIDGKTDLPYGMSSHVNEQYNYWLGFMRDNNIPTLDLRTKDNCDVFYNTDHHWNCESSYASAKEIVKKLKKIGATNGGLVNNYNVKKHPKSFLGSEGVRTGELYAGKDDFNIIIPQTDSVFHLRQIVDGKTILSREGTFEKAFIDESLLNDTEYYNKYNAFLYGGYVENIIINDGCNDRSKLLLISDSFSRSMVIYLCQAFYETRYLDPQEGRYNNSYIGYIEEYKPDVVIIMYTGDFVKE